MFYDKGIDFSKTDELIDCHIPSNYSENIDRLNEVINKIITYN